MTLDINVLKKFVPFSEIEDKYLKDVLTHISSRTFNKGDMLFKRNRSVAERYYLTSGRVDLIDARFESTTVEANSSDVSNALNLESPTICSCIAKSGVEAFTIEVEALDRIVSWQESAAYANESDNEEMVTGEIEVSNIADDDATDWMSSLLQSPLFTKIPLTQVQDLFLRFKDMPAEANETVIQEGEKGDYFYVLASGHARVTNRSESVDVVLEPGSYFGEEALLGNTPRNATIIMTESGRLKKLNAQDFEALLKEPVLQYMEQDELSALNKPHKMLDVKMPMEYRMSHVPGSINVPLARLRSSITELAKSCAYIVPDDAGSRADIAAHLLCQAGFDAYILKAQNNTEEASDA